MGAEKTREELGERAPEHAPGGRGGLVRPVRGDLEDQPEPPHPDELADQMVQDGQSGRDGRVPFRGQREADARIP